MFGEFLPNWCIMESSICDHEWLDELLRKMSELMKAF